MARKKGKSVTIAFDSIRKMIVHYDLSPNDVLSDAEIAERLNMSRTPVREAILKLMEYGLVERKDGRVVVKSISISDIIEMLQVREAVELMSTRIIIHNGGLTDLQLEKLNTLQSELQESIAKKDLDKNFYVDANFHRELVNYCGNQRLIEILYKQDVQGERLRWLTSITPHRYDSTCKEHEEIMKYIRDLDYSSAEKAIIAHIQNTLHNYQEILVSNDWEKILQTLTQLKSY